MLSYFNSLLPKLKLVRKQIFFEKSVLVFKILVLLGMIALAFWLGKTAQDSEFLKHLVSRFGYLGLFIVSVANGFNVVVPLPTISFLPLFLESGLSFTVVVLIISIGMTLADITSYLIGKTGRQLVDFKNNKQLTQFERWGRRHHRLFLLVLFLFTCFAPLPDEILLLPLGFIGSRKREIIPIVFIGNLVFNITYGFGIVSLFNLL